MPGVGGRKAWGDTESWRLETQQGGCGELEVCGPVVQGWRQTDLAATDGSGAEGCKTEGQVKCDRE